MTESARPSQQRLRWIASMHSLYTSHASRAMQSEYAIADLAIDRSSVAGFPMPSLERAQPKTLQEAPQFEGGSFQWCFV